MSWQVTVLTPNGRRHAAKYTPDTTLLQILEETCKKYNFKEEEYDLTHHNRIMDTTLILRFSGLPNNASLEMSPVKCARKESEVVLGLQLEDGSRVMGNFKPSTPVFDVLLSLAPAQSDLSTNPVVIYMRKEIFGEEALRTTTLKSLGLTGGRAIARLVHRTPEQLKLQANISTPLPQKQKEDELLFDHELPPGSAPLPKYEPRNQINVSKAVSSIRNENIIKLDSQMDVDEEPAASTSSVENFHHSAPTDIIKKLKASKAEVAPKIDPVINTKKNDFMEEVIFLGERNALVFSQEVISDMARLDDLPEDFYDLTVDEVKKLFVELRKKREELENTPLQTNNLRNIKKEEENSKKLRKNQNVVLRILFPDRTVLQGIFEPTERILVVRQFVASFLQNSKEIFDLYVTPPKKVLPSHLTLLEAECVPSAIIHFGPEDLSIKKYLKDEILDKLTPPTAALLSASVLRNNPEAASSQ